jgi:hypothetical protein
VPVKFDWTALCAVKLAVEGDSKLFSGFPFIGHRNADNNLESLCIIRTVQLRTVRWDRGRAIVQVVSRRLPTAAAWVQSQVRLCGICGGQSGTGVGFFRVLRFLLLILIAPTAPHSLSSSFIIRGYYNRPVSGRRRKWTQSHTIPRN